MAMLVSCCRGHRWEVGDTWPALLVCPQCGAAAQIDAGDSSTALPGKLAVDDVTEIPAQSAPAPLNTPRIAGYEIQRILGRGGMGVVYQALQVNLKRVVALKMILQSGADEVGLKRFHTEAEAVAHLQHPHIIQIHEIGEHEGRPYLSLEYVDGGTLSRKLARGLPMPREAAQLVEMLARAMNFAHQRGVVHRDLKPSNVLLTGDGQPKISDFGLAKRTHVELLSSGLTQTGDILGTPSYMAPEQATGEIRHIGPVTDVYALGAILYEMLTGKPPFEGENALAVVHRVVHEDPVAPTALAPRVPRDLETICLTCLAKVPDQRYASAAALADDLRAFLAGDPIQARPLTRLQRLGRWAHRKPTTAVLVAVAALACVGLLVGAWQFNALAVACVAVLSMLVAAWWYNARLQSAVRELAHEHRVTERSLERLHFLLEATQRLMAASDADTLLAILGETSARLVNADRATIYVLDADKAELWSRVAMGDGVGEIRIPLGTGISGMVGLTGETILLDDPYSDVRFNPEVDRRTGYRTRNLLTLPVKSAGGRILGVFQLLNKREGNFGQEDVMMLATLAASSATPLSRLRLGKTC
jgi:eukaryotic-like serine/threonine-protein kinase